MLLFMDSQYVVNVISWGIFGVFDLQKIEIVTDCRVHCS